MKNRIIDQGKHDESLTSGEPLVCFNCYYANGQRHSCLGALDNGTTLGIDCACSQHKG